MRERLQTAPWWVWALLTGVPFGLITGALGALRTPRPDLAGAVVSVVIGGAAYGVVMGRWVSRTRRDVAAALTGSDGDARPPSREWRRLGRAAFRGPLPSDPAERERAARLTRYWLSRYERQRWAVPMFAVMAVLGGYLALTESPAYWLFVPLFVGFLLLWVRTFRRLRRRARLLTAAPPSTTS